MRFSILRLRLLPRKRIIGLCLDDRTVSLLLLAATPLGILEWERRVEPIRPEHRLDETLGRLLAELRDDPAWRNAAMAVALPASRCFFRSQSTKPATLLRSQASTSSATTGTRGSSGTTREAVARTLFRDVFQASNLDLHDLEGAQLHKAHGRQGTDSIAAVRKLDLAPILEVLEQAGVRPFLVEPAPCALLRWTISRHRSPRQAHGVIRVILGQDRGLALLTRSDALLAWRSFEFSEAEAEAAVEPGSAILSVVRQLLHAAPGYGAIPAPDHLMVHGRHDLARIAPRRAMGRFPPPTT